MAKSDKMRIKELGATINLGMYSSLHVTIGEEYEYSGLDIKKGINYLTNIAKSVDGVLNLPKKDGKKYPESTAKVEPKFIDSQTPIYGFKGTGMMYYDHSNHEYISTRGEKFTSVTQLVGSFYPFNSKGVIAKEYMDFASSYGTMIHTAIQNTLIGKKPSKSILNEVINDVVSAIGDYNTAYVEQPIFLEEEKIAGRFDIFTDGEKNILWDVKTNSSLTTKQNNELPESIREEFGKYWDVDTIFGEHCLQLNIYAYIIERTTNIKVDEIKIIHVPDKFNRIVDVPKADITSIFKAYEAKNNG